MGKLGQHAVVSISGGQDSVTCLHWAIQHFEQVSAISFHYGQRHGAEVEQAQLICDRLNINLKKLDITEIMAISKSGLTDDSTDLTALNADGLPNSFVPNRNQMFLTIAHSYAQLVGADNLVTGVCQTDYSGYPDCRNVFIKSLEHTLSLGSGKNIEIHTPLMWLDKADTFRLALDLGCLASILTETMTCYEGDTTKNGFGMGCGKCPACVLRKNGYEEFNNRLNNGTGELV